MKPLAVVALGGNALLKKGERSYDTQLQNAKKSIQSLAPLLKKYRLIITHGNGPQVGNILLRDEAAKGKAPHLPLDVDVAQTQGEIGYILQQSLEEVHTKSQPLCLLTRALVDSKDSAFRNPTKPIGPFYSTPAHFNKKRIPFVHQSGKGYRRVVASPQPLDILESDYIKRLAKLGFTVICAGGGGIPVVQSRKRYSGVEAVVDKDLASSCLGSLVRAQDLIIVTDVPCVYLDFGKKNQKKISKLSLKEAQTLLLSHEFAPGSMAPKIQAAVNFLMGTGKRVIITNPTQLKKALIGRSGTIITRK